MPVLLHSLHCVGGDEEIRTLDPLLAGQVLSQLSYTPVAISSNFQGSLQTLKIEQRLTLLTPLNFVLVSFLSVLCEMDCSVSLSNSVTRHSCL